MTDRQIQIISKMEKLHDEIKRHPFRIGFAVEDIPSYKHLLSELTDLWCGLIYNDADTFTGNKKTDRQFGYWIHDYRANLRTYDKRNFPMQYFDYYEQMLQITHRFIETGEVDTFYNIDCFFEVCPEKCQRKRYDEVEKYELITAEKTGFDTPILPSFWPTTRPLTVDEKEVKEYFLTRYKYPNIPEEERLKEFEQWKTDTLPVLLWLNDRCTKHDYQHRAFESVLR